MPTVERVKSGRHVLPPAQTPAPCPQRQPGPFLVPSSSVLCMSRLRAKQCHLSLVSYRFSRQSSSYVAFRCPFVLVPYQMKLWSFPVFKIVIKASRNTLVTCLCVHVKPHTRDGLPALALRVGRGVGVGCDWTSPCRPSEKFTFPPAVCLGSHCVGLKSLPNLIEKLPRLNFSVRNSTFVSCHFNSWDCRHSCTLLILCILLLFQSNV